ncbi:hypothetical protein QAD02_006515 [Eretmocerus hayati]|uniref:Uncharacterized protein n=1 Tax=Eretmocerus hayati TaxID=131215 RepID=A0ACC2N172_9HYME|nr:hypothetical protein QAD02_006515 [Eretmocerus hayati]
MVSKSSRPMTLFEAVMWGTSKQVQTILEQRDLTFDDNWTDYALLIIALKRKRKEIVKLLLNKGCRTQKVPKAKNCDTPFHYAVKLSDLDIVKMLLDRNTSINDRDQKGDTPLTHAMKNNSHLIVDLILSACAHDTNATDSDNLSHFHVACMRNHLDAVKQYLKHGVDVNSPVNLTARGWPGFTALHFAVDNECIEVVELLLDHNADISIKNAEHMTSLHLAVNKKNDVIVKLILSSHECHKSNPVDKNGLSHFHIACMKNHFEAAKMFLQNGVQVQDAINNNSPVWPGFTALHFAVKESTLNNDKSGPLVELLLLSKADVNAKDVQGQTPLHLVCAQTDDQIYRMIHTVIKIDNLATHTESKWDTFCEKISEKMNELSHSNIIKLLLKYKSDVNAKNSHGETPLFYLYKNDRSKTSSRVKFDECITKPVIKEFNAQRLKILKILLDHNADVTSHNDTGQTILHFIANVFKKYDDDTKEEATELILQRGADADARTKYGSTPLHMAAKNGHAALIELLLKHKANINSSEGSDQSTPLHLATSYQQIRAINVLLKYNADVTAVKCGGMNLLHLMALMNPENSEDPEFIESYENTIKSFMERGCDVNAQDINGRTPLHLAAWEHNNAATWALIQQFADVNVEDYSGETVLSFPLNALDRCLNIYCMFRDYINVLKLAGLHLSDKVKSSYAKLYDTDPFNLNDDLFHQCREEIKRMKEIKISNYSSLFDIISKDSNEMEVYAGNDAFQNLLNSESFDKNFNIYGNLLKSQYRKGLTKKALLEKAKSVIEFMIGFGLPDSCCYRIFRFLDDKSLNNLIKAKTVVLPDVRTYKKSAPPSRSECESLESAIAYCKKLFSKQMEMDIA